jgi:hypothetical protein
MKAHKVINYESILQALGEPGCPFCRFMKNYQSLLLQEPLQKEVHHLCNFHTWGLAATQRAMPAARLFLTMLERSLDSSPTSPCDICVLLELEDDRRIREFISCLSHKLIQQWLRSRPTLCVAHGTKLRHGAPLFVSASISSLLDSTRKELAQELTHLLDDHQAGDPAWGVLGHVAEFLVSQRGLKP